MADQGSIPGLSGISGDFGRQGQEHFSRPRKAKIAAEPTPEPEAVAASDVPVAPDPTAALIQALDRLRATHELRPVETELVRALRGARYYQEESRHDLPLIDDPGQAAPDELPPDQVG